MGKRYNKLQVLLWKVFCKYYVFYLIWFQKGTLRKILIERKEKDSHNCTNCNLCCKGCVALDKKTKLCKLWGLKHITRCELFPIHPIQLQILGIKICKYCWRKKPRLFRLK